MTRKLEQARRHDGGRYPLSQGNISPSIPTISQATADDYWEHWLLAHHRLDAPSDLAYSVVFAPAGTVFGVLVRSVGTRWAVEACFQIAKSAVGLADYETRRWDGWYRHITLVLLAQAFLTVVRAHTAGVQKGGVSPCPPTD